VADKRYMANVMNNSDYNLLVLDDSKAVLTRLEQLLVGFGYNVITASLPSEAMKVLNCEFIDCILTDFEMPEMNGPDFCKQVKADDGFRQIPIIVLTSSDGKKSIMTAIESGADDYVLKSTDPDIINLKIRAMIRLRVLREELISFQRTSAVQSMVATYNHELNNPLTIAIGFMKILEKKSDVSELKAFHKIKESLARISDVVKKIKAVEANKTVRYTEKSKMMDISSPLSESSVKIVEPEDSGGSGESAA
jgi:response regulator RpfG family c-di-GMP phosphodiesterase